MTDKKPPSNEEHDDLPKTKVATKVGSNPVESFFSFENLSSLAVLIVVILAFRESVISPYHVPTASMEPTIKVGDRLLASKLAYNLKVPWTSIVVAEWASPKRGDIIVFKYPLKPQIDYVKRVIGIAGDKIEVKDDIVYINGEAQPRQPHDDRSILEDIEDNPDSKELYVEDLQKIKHWVIQNKPAQRHFGSSRYPLAGGAYTVPEDSVFVMGDNRDNSTDSRKWNEVPMSYIRGKALFVLWSAYSPPGEEWFRIRWNRFGFVLN